MGLFLVRHHQFLSDSLEPITEMALKELRASIQESKA
ncbi:BZ3500_MvSof-1268-A1-R1_Chr9g10913 [Microbotryum saponariae]|uniref:BZ3500_MvSof-1268-A1-R1_Chr9g10913 protein n=1 Tax=Microbotryum saponariae TaxID=289078 RepID=A0A2X0L8D2_9BASI|nr:BZ3501_MvSof-1269-A2-R1_Chr9g10661 [Microbotryum saponariae]SDA00908.1 BZ3500_MvSof-1268-A1-R1_Chr9g10913 [Microbotryum saponariae]